MFADFKPSALTVLAVLAPALLAQHAAASTAVLDVLAAEMDRSLEVLRARPVPVYYLSYEITEERVWVLGASFGAISSRQASESRVLDVDLRVGGYELDNTHPLRGGRSGARRRGARLEVSVSDPDALRAALWLETDRRYKDATEQLTKIRTNMEVTVGEDENGSADFSAEPAERVVEDPVEVQFDSGAWEGRLRAYTAEFAEADGVYAADATLVVTVVTRWYVNSEVTRIRTGAPQARLFIGARTKADDGMELPRFESFFAFTPDGLPAHGEVLAAVRTMAGDLHALRAAPVAEPYTGPAILSGRASGVFFHEILGHRVEGHRQRREQDAQTFKKMLGDRVLPAQFSVVFDPTARRAASTDLAGTYRFDNQGVRARRVPVIEAGILTGFLMSRTPIEGFAQSNGHGRKQPGFAPVSRQSNLFVEVSDASASDALKARMVEMLDAAGKPYGLYFEDIRGGFTTTGRGTPNAFNVLPVMVRRIYVDGREELVRGVDLIGTPLTTFSKVRAASDQLGVFNGVCGAESGGVPVSAVAPEILVSQVEVQKKAKSQNPPPLLPPPPNPGTTVGQVPAGGLR